MKYCGYCLRDNADESVVCRCCRNNLKIDVPVYHLPIGTLLNAKYMVGKAWEKADLALLILAGI